jgi:hypothetical protein
MSHIALRLGNLATSAIVIDGRELDCVRSLTLCADANEVPTLLLELDVMDVSVDLDNPDIRLGPQTSVLLLELGWTAPA